MKVGNQTMNICKPNFSPNITMTRTGEVTLKLTDSIKLYKDLENLIKLNKTVIYDLFKFKLGQQKLQWKPLEYHSFREEVA